MVGVVDLREALQQLARQLAHRGHEPVVAGRRRKVAEEGDGQVLILRQHRPDDDALAAGKAHHVDQVGGIAMDLVDHGRDPPRSPSRPRAVGVGAGPGRHARWRRHTKK